MYKSKVYKGCLRCCHYVSSFGCVSKINPSKCEFYDKNIEEKEV